MRTDRPESSALRGQLSGNSGEIEVNEQSRSPAIGDYRRTTTAIEAATAAAREGLEAAGRAAESTRIARESLAATRRLHSDLTQKERGRSADRQTLSGNSEKLSEQTVSEHFSEALQNELATVLKTHVTKLVSSLDVQEELRSLLREILPSLVQAEIEKQTKPLANQISERMNSVEQYQQKLADLIQDISSRL